MFNDTYDWTYAHLMITMVGVGLAKLMGDSVCLNLIDWLGRKQILVVGYFLTGVMSCILCILYFLDLTDENSGIEFLILVLMGVYEMGPGCVTWVMLGELFPMKVKDNAIAICLLVNFTTNYLWNEFFPSLYCDVGYGLPFLLFTLGSLGGMIFVHLSIPKMKSGSLEELQRSFSDGAVL